MLRRAAVVGCLVFSGLSALVYQIVWVRLLGFTFGTSTEAVSTVLAVFFGGLALGNLWAAARLSRVERPLRVYALLELGIGVYALASVPLLQGLSGVPALLGAGQGSLERTLLRFAGSSLVLLPPTIAMGATLPVVARGLVTEDATVGRWSALLYAANTLGAVLGAYLCGFWMIPGLGLTRTVLVAGLVNLAVSAAVLAVAGDLRAARTAPAAEAGAAGAPRGRLAFLLFFGVSGFVAIGYEIIWSKVFGIVMDGTLYGFAAVLSAFLLGIALGSLFVAPRVDRIRDLPRAFGWLHAGIALSVAFGIRAVPDLPYFAQRLAGLGALDGLHRLYLLVLPIVLVPTALFGAAFPVLVRIVARQAAAAGKGIGLATAVNTAGSILASVLVGFLWIPQIGMDRSLVLLLLLDGGIALVALAGFQRARGWDAAAGVAGCAAALALALVSFDGVRVDAAIAGYPIRAASLEEYRRLLERELAAQSFRREGRTAVVTVYSHPTHRLLRTNGLPEAGYSFQPPYYPPESMLLGVLPYLCAEVEPRRALVVGLGGGNTLDALLHTRLVSIDVVELEASVVEALGVFTAGREDPLADPRVRTIVNDGRNELLLAGHDGRPPYDLIASQPSHPWRIGAASLFTEEYFALARQRLAPGGSFAAWVNAFRIDRESFLAIVASFERVFPGSLFFDGSEAHARSDFLLLGGREPLVLDPAAMARRMREPRLAALLERFGLRSVEEVLARFEGPAAAFAAIAPRARNSDDDAFVETRVPRDLGQLTLDFAAIESALDSGSPALPPLAAPVGVARIARLLLDARVEGGRFVLGPRLERLLALHGGAVDPVAREALRIEGRIRDPEQRRAQADAVARLQAEHPARPEPWRVLARARRAVGDSEGAAAAFEQAFERSQDPADAFEAGRSLAAVDPGRAGDWFARIPAEARADHPALAYYDAALAVGRGAEAGELRAAYEALRAFRDTRAGRMHEGVDEVLAQLATRLGDERAARAFADLARERRRTEATAAVSRARRAFEAKRLDEAAAALDEAERELPSDSTVLGLRARIELERRDGEALRRALERLREFSPTLEAAVLAENRFRQENGLPLLPSLSAEALLAAPPPPPAGDGAPQAAAR
jgi:spermidine synthase